MISLGRVDNKNAVMIILLGLSAAFDKIDHKVLLQRLLWDSNVGDTALEWFRLHLQCRQQTVNIDGTVSNKASFAYGVPQGSVLGPIFFTLYTSPLGNVARQHGLQVHFYADDTQLYVTFDPRVATDEKAIVTRMATESLIHSLLSSTLDFCNSLASWPSFCNLEQTSSCTECSDV